jgi:hypothetical protein
MVGFRRVLQRPIIGGFGTIHFQDLVRKIYFQFKFILLVIRISFKILLKHSHPNYVFPKYVFYFNRIMEKLSLLLLKNLKMNLIMNGK